MYLLHTWRRVVFAGYYDGRRQKVLFILTEFCEFRHSSGYITRYDHWLFAISSRKTELGDVSTYKETMVMFEERFGEHGHLVRVDDPHLDQGECAQITRSFWDLFRLARGIATGQSQDLQRVTLILHIRHDNTRRVRSPQRRIEV